MGKKIDEELFQRHVKLVDSLKDKSPEIKLNTERAAIYLGLGKSTLAQWRSNNKTPPYYYQYEPGKKGSPCFYLLGELRDFDQQLRQKGTSHAHRERHIRRHASFTAYPKLMPFEPGHPFWVKRRFPNVLIDSIYGGTVDFERAFEDPTMTIRQITWRRALSMCWQEESLRKYYLEIVCAENPLYADKILKNLGNR